MYIKLNKRKLSNGWTVKESYRKYKDIFLNFDRIEVFYKLNLLQKAHDWIQNGYEIKYLTLNQFENGYGAEVLAGDMPKFTYSFFIDKEGEELWDYSVDSLEEGYSMAIDWLEKHGK